MNLAPLEDNLVDSIPQAAHVCGQRDRLPIRRRDIAAERGIERRQRGLARMVAAQRAGHVVVDQGVDEPFFVCFRQHSDADCLRDEQHNRQRREDERDFEAQATPHFFRPRRAGSRAREPFR